MRRSATVVIASLGIAASLGGAVPAGAAKEVTPRSGKFAGEEVVDANPLPVSFSVSKDRARVVDFTGQAAVRAGCANHITGFQAPTGPMAISTNGQFSADSTNYPQDGVRVRVVGTFVSRTKARGHIIIKIAKMRDCNISRPFTATRARTSEPEPAT